MHRFAAAADDLRIEEVDDVGGPILDPLSGRMASVLTSPSRRFTKSSLIFLAPQCGLFFLHETIIASTGSGNWLAYRTGRRGSVG
ncbi:hypothetical protein LJR255_005027 [Pararhizobium sp. LjRoot255]